MLNLARLPEQELNIVSTKVVENLKPTTYHMRITLVVTGSIQTTSFKKFNH